LAKRFIEKIVYAKQDIEIMLFYGLNSQISEIKNKAVLREQDVSNFSGNNDANPFLSQKNKFADDDSG